MSGWSIDEMLSLPTCYSRAQYESLWNGAPTLTSLQVCQHSGAPADDRAQILSHMLDNATARLWACDMVEGMGIEFDGVADVLALSRGITDGSRKDSERREGKRKFRRAPSPVRALLHDNGGVACRLVYSYARTAEPDNGAALLSLLATRLGG